jgi:type IV secretory pathway TrbD component
LCPFACGATRHVLMFVDLLCSVVGRHGVCWLLAGFVSRFYLVISGSL